MQLCKGRKQSHLSKVGQEFIDYYGVDPATCSVEYYSFGTGLTVYHSYDNLNWTCIGDSQGRFGYQNQEKYNIPVTINAGATIDFLAGNKKRAPKWMVDGGLEWLYRTMKEPKRVGGRVLRDLAVFPLAWKYRPRK